MNDKVLKVVPAPDAKSAPDRSPDVAAETPPAASKKRNLRRTLLIVLPLAAALIGGTIYLMGGRYISTDNAYVGAQKVLITPDIAGKVVNVKVKEGQLVKAGDELLSLDRVPFELTLAQSRAKLDTARAEYNRAKSNLESLNTLNDLAQQNVELKQRDVERKQRLVASQSGSPADVDTSTASLVAARLQAQNTKQQLDQTLSSLLGDPNLPLDKFPDYAQAKAAVESAERDLAHTVLRAPIDGTATQVDNVQLGRYVSAGDAILSIIDNASPWVDANPKETDITYLRLGQKATLAADSFPDRPFTGTVIAVSPGTGSQFSIIPAQNATGNWVKVVQRVPVRIAFDKNQDLSRLRTGMSVNIEIDTHHSRLPFASRDPEAK